MKSLQRWLNEYGEDHQDETNRLLHKICVPIIFATIAGAIHLVPYGDYAAAAAILSYLRWGIRPFAIMLLTWAISLKATLIIERFANPHTIWVLLVIFALAWFGQFIGHYIEGRRPSFLTDLQYLLIGPLWIWLGH